MIRSASSKRRFLVLVSSEGDFFKATLVHWDDAEPDRFARFRVCRLQHRAFADERLSQVLCEVIEYAGRKFREGFVLES